MMTRLWMIFIGVCLSGALAWAVLNNQSTTTELKQVSEKLVKADEDHAVLEKKYKDLEADRDNVLAQTKNLLKVQSQYNELKTTHAELEKTKRALENQREKLIQYNQKVDKEKSDALQKLDRSSALLKQVQLKVQTLQNENEELKAAALKKASQTVASSPPEVQQVTGETAKLKSENAALSKSAKELSDNLRKALDRIKALEGGGKKVQTLEAENKKLAEANKTLMSANKTLGDTVNNAPKQFKDASKENNTLKAETGRMHYNMGVLFLENKKPDKALQEFKRAVDLDPDNAAIHYNLAVLYADMERPDMAMAHFHKFLDLDPNSKRANEARAYIVEREAYGDKISKL